jgi:curved DNA-binding protein
MTDHYAALGVAKTASQDEIKKAFRKLASLHHPDKGGDTAKFQEIQAAYDTLGDATKRQQYDNPASQFGNFGPGGFGFNFNNGPQFNDIFGQMFGQPRQSHLRMTAWITLVESVKGGAKQVALGSSHGQQAVQIEIPKGIEDGDSVQYSGIAPGGQDLIVQYRIHPHPVFRRQGLDLHRDLNVPLWDLVIGGDIEVDGLLDSRFSMRIPARTNPGTVMRVRGQGTQDRNGQSGDLYVHVAVKMPELISPELIAAIQQHRD